MKLSIYNGHISSDFSGLKIDNFVLTISKDIEQTIIIEGYNDQKVNLEINIVNSNVKIIESNINNLNINFNLSKNSFLNYQSVNEFNYESIKNVNIFSDSNFKYEQIDVKSINENINISLNDENTSAKVKYLVLNGNNNSDVKVKINHLAKNTFSEVNNYAIVTDNASVDFEIIGKIDNGNSKSSCIQLTKGIIIGKNANIIAKPILQIDEFDVKAYHGASIGKMSDEDLFYLMSRGLTKTEAFKLILTGVINPFIDVILVEDIKEKINQSINQLIEG